MANNEYLSDTDLEQINKNQSIRNTLIDNILASGLPENKETQSFLVSLLNGSDNSVFNKAKLKARKDENEDNKAVVDMMAKLLLHSNEISRRESIPTLGNNITIVPVEGEKDTNPEEMSYETFCDE